MTQRQILTRKIASYDFSIVELNLYLDTHPRDTQALKKLAEYEDRSHELRTRYEEEYGPIEFRNSPDTRMRWIKSPWPWDLSSEEEC